MTASMREWIWSFSRMFRTWFFTVFSEMNSSLAMSRLFIPRATSLSTSISRSVSLGAATCWVRAVYGGQSLINPSMAGKLLTEFATLANRDTSEDRVQHVAAPKLTDREMEVLKLVARGMNNRDIAKELFISENTVKNHVRNILEKLQIHSRMEAVMIAVRQKLIEFG